MCDMLMCVCTVLFYYVMVHCGTMLCVLLGYGVLQRDVCRYVVLCFYVVCVCVVQLPGVYVVHCYMLVCVAVSCSVLWRGVCCCGIYVSCRVLVRFDM